MQRATSAVVVHRRRPWLLAVGFLASAVPLSAQNALVVEADRVATASDLASGGKLQLGDLTAGSASCIAVDSDRPYADLDCDETKDAGEEYLDGGGGGGSSDPLLSEYHPDRPPASYGTGGFGEEFANDGEELTWETGNWGTSTINLAMDRCELVPQLSGGTGYSMRARFVSPPGGISWVASMKARYYSAPDNDSDLEAWQGMVALLAGSVAAPTAMRTLAVVSDGTDDRWRLVRNAWSSYTSASNNDGTHDLFAGEHTPVVVYSQMRYDATADQLSMSWSLDGVLWLPIGSTLTGVVDPLRIGFFSSDLGTTRNQKMFVDWFRLRTDAAGLSGLTGE